MCSSNHLQGSMRHPSRRGQNLLNGSSALRPREVFPLISLQAGFYLRATHANRCRPPEMFIFIKPGFLHPAKLGDRDAEEQPPIDVSPWAPSAASSMPEEARCAVPCQPQPALAQSGCRCFLFPLTSLATCSAVPHFYACPEEGRELTLETQLSLQLS